jgi:hypothetical protein
MYSIAVFLVDQVTWRRFILQRTDFLARLNQPNILSTHVLTDTYTMRAILHDLMRVLETPLTDI